eukprot:gb/GECG01010604.1/.p1 GENE.gb/GECG01010604.1/~~gb/GECG01010604.1/.p1  ORF type:complete len:270 (+),score=19.17 gb/GECG01010604.1/:1-810(+)
MTMSSDPWWTSIVPRDAMHTTEAVLFMLLGAACLAIWLSGRIMRLFRCIHRFLTPVNLRQMGEYGVVTGATDGIGKAYAMELAKRGLNIVLIARNEERLRDTAAEISKACPKVNTKIVVADFNTYPEQDPELYNNIARKLKGLDIGVLINNVGCSYPSALFYHELEDLEETKDIFDRMIRLNVSAATHMTRIVVKGMVEKGRGAIINISSAAGRIPIGNPLYAQYSASKAYVVSTRRLLSALLQRIRILLLRTRALGCRTFLHALSTLN